MYHPMYQQQMGFPYQEPLYPVAPIAQFPSQLQVPVPAGTEIPQAGPTTLPAPSLTPSGVMPLELSYIENILRLNRGKQATFYMTFEYNPEWPAKIFRGIIDEAGRDHIIIRNEETGKSYLLLMVDLDYVEFDEPIAYHAPGFILPAPQR